MVRIFAKLYNNIFSWNAVKALGLYSYLFYLTRFALNILKIYRVGNLSPLDKAMGSTAKDFRYRGGNFIFDCAFCDASLSEDSYAFGIAREIYIRDCYFNYHPEWVYKSAKTVVDLGGNRGGFSTLMTSVAEKIVIVECFDQYSDVIKHNLLMNKFTDFSLENSFIGEGGMTASDSSMITMNELFDRYNLDKIDFIKMDIEGSEFSLFRNSDWLERVNSISMEVHAECGPVSEIAEILRSKGFLVRMADENLAEVEQSDHDCFIYAWRE